MDNINSIDNKTASSKILNVLLVDDNPIDNYINERLFSRYGKFNCRVFQAANEALEHLMQSKIRYDYLVVDIYMPGMDGFTFIEQFNRLLLNKIHGKLIILSVSLNPIDRVKSKMHGLMFMEKPFRIERLLIS